MFEHKISPLINNSEQFPEDGVIILTGPSSCGKGSVASVLADALKIQNSLSMGQVLRDTYARANSDAEYAQRLEKDYNISSEKAVIESSDSNEALTEKIVTNKAKLQEMLDKKYSGQAKKEWHKASQIDWLEFCTTKGFLVPDRWTKAFIESYLKDNIAYKRKNLCLLDGYPRTTEASIHLLDTLEQLELPIHKVLHLSISEQEMIKRALLRNRVDDTSEALKERFNFYSKKIQPSVDYMKERLGSNQVALIDAHQPIYNRDGILDVPMSVMNVAFDCLVAIGASRKLAVSLLTPLSSKVKPT